MYLSRTRLISYLQTNPFFRKLLYGVGRKRGEALLAMFRDELQPRAKILDIGAGSCNIAELLQEAGFTVTALDIRDTNFTGTVSPVVFDGAHVPYPDQSFDAALVLTVLHHTTNQEAVLREAKRVARTVIVIEDVFGNRFEKYLTFFCDSVLNLEFTGHPHANRADVEWRKLFSELGFSLRNTARRRMGMFQLAMYTLEQERG